MSNELWVVDWLKEKQRQPAVVLCYPHIDELRRQHEVCDLRMMRIRDSEMTHKCAECVLADEGVGGV